MFQNSLENMHSKNKCSTVSSSSLQNVHSSECTIPEYSIFAQDQPEQDFTFANDLAVADKGKGTATLFNKSNTWQ